MEHSKSSIIKEIAQELDCGNDCYYNNKTDMIIAIPNFSNLLDEEEFQEVFSTDLKSINKNKADYIKIAVLESHESFKIMALFAEKMPENQLKKDLISTLSRKKTFQNFKNIIETSDHRASWFAFKQSELENIMRARLNIK